ncbi:OprO/OprP family phosphate-selective porin [Psychroflexus sp. CAK8W]|uniref:OprO/OprP family phosphate-selective porin n=1 Tax=Psychroflexus longus TaxID=2873596 RepID=A0ABS7XHT5_9FLAO|nr:porin [Psychroflexus longus]MBZ9778528.1 OprO/OprP family phosphate-selective porin [Psychroflexus longus]
MLVHLFGLSQEKDSLNSPLISVKDSKIFESINIGFDIRTEFQAYRFSGGDQFPNGVQFENGFTALNISGKLHEKVDFNFRNRFNSSSEVQSLDRLSNDIQLAYIKVEASEKLNFYVGKMFAFYGGYEFEYSPLYILEYNDIYSNALAFVTGAGLSYQAFENHQFRFQVLNSRTLLYEDLYGDVIAEDIEEPIWPVNVVANWRGSFFDGKLETHYSASRSNEVKNQGTYFFTLGHKYQNNNFKLMYDFQYSYEEIDTKRIINNLLAENEIAENVLYIENWLRAEYQLSPKFKGLLTLMTSTAYNNYTTSRDHVRTSFGAIPTIAYSPFKDLDLQFFIAYVGRYYDYSNYAKTNFNVSSYNKNEIKIGIIAPLNLL